MQLTGTASRTVTLQLRVGGLQARHERVRGPSATVAVRIGVQQMPLHCVRGELAQQRPRLGQADRRLDLRSVTVSLPPRAYRSSACLQPQSNLTPTSLCCRQWPTLQALLRTSAPLMRGFQL